ncbi:MAG: hypothetical protein AB2598_04080 [Candidatus Thiodiazotropha sp.]
MSSCITQAAEQLLHGDHAGHRHEGHAPKREDLLGAVNDCLDMGPRRIFHCLATSNSGHLGAYAKICRSVCAECEDECREHEDKHMECKACAGACAAMVKAIEKALA